MTAEEFVALYKGHRARVNENALSKSNVDKIVRVLRVSTIEGMVRVDSEQSCSRYYNAFFPNALDVIEDEPLPLPG